MEQPFKNPDLVDSELRTGEISCDPDLGVIIDDRSVAIMSAEDKRPVGSVETFKSTKTDSSCKMSPLQGK